MIFGTSRPCIIYGSDTIELDHSTVKVDWNKTNNTIENKSVKAITTGDISNTFTGKFCEFTITVALYKYADPLAKFNELYQLNHKVIDQLWYHGDSTNSLGVKFFVYSITMGKVFEDMNDYDTMTLILTPCNSTAGLPHANAD
jgi:hypothetical protein